MSVETRALESLSQIEQNILAEIENARKSFGDQWGLYYFNNFQVYLPGGSKRNSDPLTKKYEYDCLASIKIRNQTNAEFWDSIDSAIVEVGIDGNTLSDALSNFVLSNGNYNGESLKLFDLIVPLYIKLIQKGYHRYPDLTV
jgi:hypothetical protein